MNEGISATWSEGGNEFTGKWIDTRTGSEVFVRNNITDADGNIILITNKGNVSLAEFGNFVKMSEEDYGQQGLSPELSGNQLLAAVNAGLDSSEKIERVTEKPSITLDTPIGGDVKNIVKQPTQTESTPSKQPTQTVESVNLSLIKKVMDKYENAITIEFNINPDEWPKNELQMLVNTFDVTPEELCDYIIEKFLDKTALIGPLKEYIMSVLTIDIDK